MAARMQKPPKGKESPGGFIQALFEVAYSYHPPEGKRQLIANSDFQTRGVLQNR
jgi:hypothetical protein